MNRLLLLGVVVAFLTVPSICQTKHRKQLVPSVPVADRVGTVILRNPSVTVRRISLDPRSEARVPSTMHDYLLVALSTAKLQALGSGSAFDMQFGMGEMQVMQGGWVHRIVNTGTEPAEVLAIEVARNIDPRHPKCGLGGTRCNEVRFGKAEGGEFSQTALFETGTTKLMRAQLSSGGALRLHADGRRHLLIAITDVQAHTETGNLSLSAGEVHWLNGGFEELVNDGTMDAQMLIVEVKD